ncbi:MAG: class B sortase [Faecalibacterium sp.]|jgi:sortase B|nr:class B sortase [Faecalibacterium sp.]
MKKGAILRRVLFLVALAMIVVPAIWLGATFWQYAKADQEYTALAQSYAQPAASAGSGSTAKQWQPLSIDWDALRAKNPQVVAWIEADALEGLSYPVVRAEDDAYYLTHSYLGAENTSGAIFMETLNRGDFSDAYTILYGHNMKSGRMFGQLKKYASADFYAENGGWLTIYTPEHIWRYQIFSAEYAGPADADVYTIGYTAGTEEYGRYLQAMAEHSLYDTEVPVSAGDSVITLSTCSGQENRFVVHAVRTETIA